MAPWSEFHPELMLHVTGCPTPLADQALRHAAREFFRRTRAWRQWLEPLTTIAGVREYDLELPTGAMVVRIERSTVNGDPMAVLSHNDQASNPEGYDQSDRGIVSRDRATFTTTQALAAGSRIEVEVSLMPNRTATGIPNDLFAQHCEDIVNGAKHRLMLTPDTTFYKPDLAMAAKTEFESAINAKTAQAWRGFTGRTPRARVSWV